MKPYQILMAVALLGSGALVLFGDRTPDDGVAEPVQRAQTAGKPAAMASASAAAAASASASAVVAAPSGTAATPRNASAGKAQPPVAILRLTPRSALVGESAEATFASGEGIFQGHNWNPPPPPEPPTNAVVTIALPSMPPPPPKATFPSEPLADGVATWNEEDSPFPPLVSYPLAGSPPLPTVT